MDTTEDGCGHQFAVARSKDTVRTDSAGVAQDSAWTQTRFLDRNGTNDHEQPRSVPLLPICSLVGIILYTPSQHSPPPHGTDRIYVDACHQHAVPVLGIQKLKYTAVFFGFLT